MTDSNGQTVDWAAVRVLAMERVDDLLDNEQYGAARALVEALVGIRKHEPDIEGHIPRAHIESVIYSKHRMALLAGEYEAGRALGLLLVDIHVKADAEDAAHGLSRALGGLKTELAGAADALNDLAGEGDTPPDDPTKEVAHAAAG